jgi:hypothetical protein
VHAPCLRLTMGYSSRWRVCSKLLTLAANQYRAVGLSSLMKPSAIEPGTSLPGAECRPNISSGHYPPRDEAECHAYEKPDHLLWHNEFLLLEFQPLTWPCLS